MVKNIWNKMLSVMLCAVLACALVPAVALADNGGQSNELSAIDSLTIESRSYIDLYKPIIKKYPTSKEALICEYYVCDIDSDGVYELLVEEGTCEADREVHVYTIETSNNFTVVEIGSFSGWHSTLFVSSDGTLYKRDFGATILDDYIGVEGYYAITKQGNTIEEKEVCIRYITGDENLPEGIDRIYTVQSCKINHPNTDYTAVEQLGDVQFEILDDEFFTTASSIVDQWENNEVFLNYLRNDAIYPHYVTTAANDETFMDKFIAAETNMLFRGVDGWKDIFYGATKREDAETIIIALLNVCETNDEVLNGVKTGSSIAGKLALALKTYLKSERIDNSVVEEICSFLDDEKIADLIDNCKFDEISDIYKTSHPNADSYALGKLSEFTKSTAALDVVNGVMSDISPALKIASITNDVVQRAYELESVAKANDTYKEMVNYIANTCGYSIVKEAASNVYRLTNAKYEELLGELVTYASLEVTETAFVEAVDKYIKALPYGAAAKDAFDTAVDFSEFFLKNGDTQEQRDKMRTLAYMGHSMSNFLIYKEASYLQVREQKSVESEQLACDVISVANMLINVRLSGEEAYRAKQKNLHQDKSLFTGKYKAGYSASLDVQSYLTSIQDEWFKKDCPAYNFMSTTVSCPVDVKVLDSMGNEICVVVDGREGSGSVNDIDWYSYLNPITGDYEKVVVFPDQNKYRFELIGQDEGTVSCLVCKPTASGEDDRFYFMDVSVTNSSFITMAFDNGVLPQTYTVQDGGSTTTGEFNVTDKVSIGSTDPAIITQTMYRLYNPNSGEHFYTASEGERNHLIGLGWDDEGTGWIAPTTGDPVYRLYNPNAGEHHYTKDAAEKASLEKAGWTYESIGWYSGGDVRLYREYNPNAYANNHNYTTDKGEHDWLLSLGWRDEGYAWNAVSAS